MVQLKESHRFSFFYKNTLLSCFTLAFFVFSCKKTEPDPPTVTSNYSIQINNQYSGIGSTEAAWLSDSDGKVHAFSWLEGNENLSLEVSDADQSAVFDLTILRLTKIVGQGANDSTFSLKTYQGIPNGKTVGIGNLSLKESILLDVKFNNLITLDSIFVPDALVFEQPKASNDFKGKYLCNHTGQLWFRFKANGYQNWQYVYSNNATGTSTQITIEDASILPNLFDPPPKLLRFPFLTFWSYDIQAATKLSENRFLPIGDIIRPPGGIFPLTDAVLVYQPKPSFINIAEDGYRLHIEGTGDTYTYHIDQLFSSFPDSLPALDFGLDPTTVTGPRIASVFCTGTIDALVYSRNYAAGLVKANWEAWASAPPNAVKSYRLPDFPSEVSSLFPVLATYPFQGKVTVRAESYAKLSGYQAVLDAIFINDDPLWQMHGEYLGYGIEF